MDSSPEPTKERMGVAVPFRGRKKWKMQHLLMYTSGCGFPFCSTNSDQLSRANQYPVGELTYVFLRELLDIPLLVKGGLKAANLLFLQH